MDRDIVNFYEEDTRACRYLTFIVDDTVYGVQIADVNEIVPVLPITKIPESPPHLMGVVNLRGKVLPVIDMRIKFGKPKVEYTDRTCIIFVDIQELLVGLIVDGVHEVIYIADEDIVQPPGIKADNRNKYLRGIGKVGEDVKLILDCNEILREEELKKLRE